MKRTRLSPIDIVGIALGTLAALLVVGSIVGIAQGRVARFRFSAPEMRGWWDGRELFQGSGGLLEEDRTVEGSFSEVEIGTVAGSIEVIGGSEGAVRIHSVKSAPAPGGLDGLRVDVQELGGRLVIEERRDSPPAGWQRSISFTVTIPPSVKIVRAHTVSGDVRVRGAGTAVDQWLRTVSGSVSTDGARDLHASSTSGSVDFVFAGKTLDAHTISGSVTGTVDAVEKGGSLVVRSTSGSVTLRAFDGLDASVDLHSLSGGVSCGFPLTVVEQKRNRLQGRIGRGSVPVEIGTTSGRISLGRR